MVIDEFSRFPFAFTGRDISSATVMECLYQLFVVFGMPHNIHSDRGPFFMSSELKDLLHLKGITISCITSYNP